jgi:glycosyltransferase involved in cell wall biosynthesis
MNEQPLLTSVMQPLLSVILATFNRAETLRTTLRHLADQELDPNSYEVIVIDDGSPDHTAEVVKQWIETAPFRLTYLYHSNHGPGYTQNRGLEVARAPIVLLMADDIWMAPQALRAHLAVHAAHPEQEVAVLGRVQQSPSLDQSVFLRTWDPFRFSDLAGRVELPYYKFWACNISVKREFVLRYGPFQEHLGEAAHEDPELGYRLSRGGLRILHCPDALGYHHHIMTIEQACRRRHVQGRKFGEFCRLVPEPEIPVAYHVLNWRTVPDHLRALFGPRRKYLSAADRNLFVLLALTLMRALSFNAITVKGLWEPLIRMAEKSPRIARIMNREIYRGVLFHYFLRGCRDGSAGARERIAVPQAGTMFK